MNEKSRKDDKNALSDDALRKPPNSSKSNLATKYGFGKRKSSGDNEETSPKAAKLDNKPKPIKMAMQGSQKQQEAALKPISKKMSVAAAFGDDSDSEPEEMPPEAKMRMKNIGRETPTAAGPNSFGKTKFGFTDTHRKHERLLLEVAKKVDG